MSASFLIEDVATDSCRSLARINQLLSLPDRDGFTEDERRIALQVRLRLWRSGPAEPGDLQAAVAAELAEDGGEHDADRIAALLEGDDTLADPPDADEVAGELIAARRRFYEAHRPAANGDGNPVQPDRFGNWPGTRWRDAVDWSLDHACRPNRHAHIRQPLTAHSRIAHALLSQEMMNAAAARAERESQQRQASVERAHEIVDAEAVWPEGGNRQAMLRLLAGFAAEGRLQIPTTGHPVAAASLCAEIASWELEELTAIERAEVANELIAFAMRHLREPAREQIVPAGYGIVRGEHGRIADVTPGSITLAIEPEAFKLESPLWAKPVRMNSRQFLDPRMSQLAVFVQAGVDVEAEHGFWRRWWPSLRKHLLATANTIDGMQQKTGWLDWLRERVAEAPSRQDAAADAAVYIDDVDGKAYALRQPLIDLAIASGLIDETQRDTFGRFIGKAECNRRDADGRQRRVVALAVKPAVVIEAVSSQED